MATPPGFIDPSMAPGVYIPPPVKLAKSPNDFTAQSGVNDGSGPVFTPKPAEAPAPAQALSPSSWGTSGPSPNQTAVAGQSGATGTGGGTLPVSPPPPASTGPVVPPVSSPATGSQTSTAKTVTVGGKTYSIPSAPMSQTAEGVEAPSADAPELAYNPEDPMLGVVREQLLALMARANQPPSLSDPTLAPQAQAFSTEQERARREMLADQAESLSARGLGSSGAMDTARQQSWEKAAQAIGSFNANLLGQEQAARRQDLTSALEMANTLGMFQEKTALERDLATLDTQTKVELANLNAELAAAGLSMDERLAIMGNEMKKYGIDTEANLGLLNTILKNEFDYAQLNLQGQLANLDAKVKMDLANLDATLRREGYSTQERLAQIDAELRRYGIDTQGDLGRLDAAIRKELGIGQLNLGLLNAMMGNQQFYDSLGWDMDKFVAGANAGITNLINP